MIDSGSLFCNLVKFVDGLVIVLGSKSVTHPRAPEPTPSLPAMLSHAGNATLRSANGALRDNRDPKRISLAPGFRGRSDDLTPVMLAGWLVDLGQVAGWLVGWLAG